MEYTIEIMFAVLLTTITGSIFAVTWYLVGKLLEWAGFLNILFSFLKAVVFSWCVPLAFILWVLASRQQKLWMGQLFVATPAVIQFSRIFCVVWFVGTAIFLIRLFRRNFCLAWARRHAIPCKSSVRDLFEQVCGEMGVSPSRVRIAQSYNVTVPCACGVFRPMVVLPAHRQYDEKTLRVVLMHELTHYRQRDLFFKQLAGIACALNFFNPIVWIFRDRLDEWCEYQVDYGVCRKLGSMKQYFGVILFEATGIPFYGSQVSHLFEKESSLKKRVVHMDKYIKKKAHSRKAAAFVVGGLAMISIGLVGTTSVGAAQAYAAVYEETNVEEIEPLAADITGDDGTVTDDGLVEFIDTEDDADYTIIKDEEPSAFARSATGHYDWEIAPLFIRQTKPFHGKSGKTITLAAVIDPNKQVYLGIIEPDGVKRCVYTCTSTNHTFLLDQTGYYRVYARNPWKTTTMTVAGAYLSKY